MRRPRKVVAQMNVVPYIDVMLVLLVIFMVTAPMLRSGVEVNQTKADAKPLTGNNNLEPVIVTVDSEGKYYLEGKEAVSLDEVTRLVKEKVAQNADYPVYIKPDKSVQAQYLVQAMVALQKSGANKIGVTAEPERKP